MLNTRVRACTLLLLAGASAALAQDGQGRKSVRPGDRNSDVQVVDAVTRDGVQTFMGEEPDELPGRAWSGATVTGGIRKLSRLEAAAAQYGAVDEARRTVVVYVEGLFPGDRVLPVTISPWVEVRAMGRDVPVTDPYSRARGRAAERVEAARQRWLSDHGYTGGVRTHVNEATPAAGAPLMSAPPQPRGVIEVAPDVPRFRSRMRVDTGDVTHPQPRGTVVRAARVIKVLPPTQPAADATVAAPTIKQPDAVAPAKTVAPAENGPSVNVPLAQKSGGSSAADMIVRNDR